jgi:uncharacterized membrane protein
VATQAHQVVDRVYPRRLAESRENSVEFTNVERKGPSRTVACPMQGVVLAFDVRGLVRLAARHDCVIELVPQVGTLVAPENPLFRIYGGTGFHPEVLQHSIALGTERTMEQDPALGFRVIVDIACKALSPAINDPTTAVLAVDQIHHLLRHLGNRCLDDEQIRDSAGKVRLLYRTPDWEDFVTLAITEIRQFGGGSIQVVRRMRAMLEDLIENLPDQRRGPLRQELTLLHRTVARHFPEPEDQALANESDVQGVGGTEERHSPEHEREAMSS